MIKTFTCPFLVFVHLLGVIIGLIIFFIPSAVIEFQRKFYEKINWRIEPISMPKEITNTKFMGLSLTIFTFLSMIYILSLR